MMKKRTPIIGPYTTPTNAPLDHWFRVLLGTGCLLFLQLGPAAHAVPPLMPAADIAQADLVGWWREGDLIVGIPTAQDRPGMRPLTNLAPIPLPSDLSDWEPVGHTCTDKPMGVAALNNIPVEGHIGGDPDHPVVELRQNNRIVAHNALGRPAKVCEIRIVQADAIPGLELIIAWRASSSDKPIQGITVFRVPESLSNPPNTTD